MDIEQVPPGSIVVGIDGSSLSDAALSWAVEQASLEQRALTVVHSLEPTAVVPGSTYATTGIDYGRLLDAARDAARALVTTTVTRVSAERPELTVHHVLTYADPRRALLTLSGTAAMVVVGSRGRGPVASLLLGSVSVSVSKHAACPVVVHRPTPTDQPGRGILLGVDGTALSLPAIEFAYRMASWRALPLTVLHCFRDAAPVAALLSGVPLPESDAEQALVAESLAGMEEKFPDVEVHVRLTRGVAERHLVAASLHHDLVVVGHLPLSALDDLRHGSLAPVVVEHASGAVAVVPSTPSGAGVRETRT